MTRGEKSSVSRVALVVVNYGSSALIEANFAHLASIDDAVVIVVDNFSSVAETERIRAVCSDLGFTLLALESNVGFGAGMNAGVARADELGCQVVILINPDAIADPQLIDALREQCESAPMTMVSPRVLRGDGSVWFGGGDVRVSEGITTTRPGSDSSSPTGWLSGACLALTMQLWHASGGFDDDYFLYWEDVDLSWRVRSAGGALLVRDDLVVRHDVGGTQVGEGKSPLYVYYNVRNRMLFARKHLSATDTRRWLASTPRFAWRVMFRGGRRAWAHHPVTLTRAALRGAVNGARWRPHG